MKRVRFADCSAAGPKFFFTVEYPSEYVTRGVTNEIVAHDDCCGEGREGGFWRIKKLKGQPYRTCAGWEKEL